MAILPYTRIVDVTLTRSDRFAAVASFGTPLVLTAITSATGANATTRTKTYATLSDVAADYATSSEPYLLAATLFEQNPHPLQIKIGFVAPAALTTAATMTAQLTSLSDADNGFYIILPTHEFSDLEAPLDAMISWVQAQRYQLFVDSFDANTEDAAVATSVAARNKGKGFTRTAIFYSTHTDEYLAAAAGAYVSRRNFDNPNSAFTLKFKTMTDVSRIDKPSSVITAITGFVPAVGLSTAAGHLANCYINIGGVDFIVEGTNLAGGFVDETLMGDWLVARTEEALLNAFLKNDRIPYDDPGIQILVGAVDATMASAASAGLIADDLDPQTGDYLPSYQISTMRVADVPEAQRRQRIAPLITVQFRQAGAVHYASVAFNVTV